MAKHHRSRGPRPVQEQNIPVQEQQPDKQPGPQYASEVNPEAPYLDHEPAMRWELRELAHRVEILEAALADASQTEGEGEAASAPA